ncbi:1750_t:CDS:2, partial [Rhizophagus irregularis]
PYMWTLLPSTKNRMISKAESKPIKGVNAEHYVKESSMWKLLTKLGSIKNTLKLKSLKLHCRMKLGVACSMTRGFT